MLIQFLFFYWMENITTEEVIDKLDIFRARFGKVDEFGWWDMEIIQTDAGMHFTSQEFQKGLSVRGLWLSLVAPHHQEMIGQIEVKWWTLQTISYSIMVHARVDEEYINFALMYKTGHIFPVLPIKDFSNQDGGPTMPHKL